MHSYKAPRSRTCPAARSRPHLTGSITYCTRACVLPYTVDRALDTVVALNLVRAGVFALAADSATGSVVALNHIRTSVLTVTDDCAGGRVTATKRTSAGVFNRAVYFTEHSHWASRLRGVCHYTSAAQTVARCTKSRTIGGGEASDVASKRIRPHPTMVAAIRTSLIVSMMTCIGNTTH